MNFSRDVVDAAPAGDRALVELAREGDRREWTFGEVADRSARLAGALTTRGVGRGDVVMTLIGNRPDWVLTMVACFRIGAVALPCNEQLRAKDLRLRVAAAQPRLIVADRRDASELTAAAPGCEVVLVPDESLLRHAPAPAPLPRCPTGHPADSTWHIVSTARCWRQPPARIRPREAPAVLLGCGLRRCPAALPPPGEWRTCGWCRRHPTDRQL